MRRILFVKTSSLGDVVHHCPAVTDAARHFPGAVIDWVVEEAFAAIPPMHPAVRRALPVALRRWRRSLWSPASWSEMRRFRRQLGGERYDAVIDTQSLVKSALIASAAEGVRHGLDRASAREPLAARFYDVAHAVPKGQHAVERNRQLVAAALGYAVEGAPDYGLKKSPAHGSGEHAVFLTMTSRADKLWPEERWIALGRALGRRVVLPWGSDGERERATRIRDALGSDATVPARMTLAELAALFAGAHCVVGTDTGLTHLAAAMGARTVGLYGGSDPALTGLYGAPSAVNLGAPGRMPAVAEVTEALL
ncbi:MAG TPA: lipopolysaccharide heptosyltransferase I [Myxococcota bacterium]|jgi:heptosyltransferase-1|nr:lipopolysaccharide heptosyltransferase I [Myxococcota bacterium]